jgi:transforming growth factor-beta-induced protein
MKNGIVILVVMTFLVALFAAGCTQTTPPTTPTPTPTTLPPTTIAPKTCVDIAVADGRFTTLVAALQAANLTETLSGPGPFTIFAPTDDAFNKLPAGTVDTLLQDPGGQLTQILLYHVVAGKFMASDVILKENLTSLQGSPIAISVMNETVMVDGATVLIPDIECSNGVIHVIDSVILPPA